MKISILLLSLCLPALAAPGYPVGSRMGSLGNTIGPSSATDGQIALFNGATGKVFKAASGTGVVHATAGAYSTSTTTIPEGGTGQTTANAALNALLPSQTSNSGKVLQTNGTNTSWQTASSGIAGTWGATTNSIVTTNGASTAKDNGVVSVGDDGSYSFLDFYNPATHLAMFRYAGNYVFSFYNSGGVAYLQFATDLFDGFGNTLYWGALRGFYISPPKRIYAGTEGLFAGLGSGDPATAYGTITNDVLTTKDGHWASRQTTAPTTGSITNLGTGGSCSVTGGTDTVMKMVLTSGSVGTPASGAQCTITFNKPYNVAPICTATPMDAGSGLNAVGVYWPTATTTLIPTFTVAGGTSTTYTYAVSCFEPNS